MEIKYLDNELLARGLQAPKLALLTPDNHPYRALVYQPQGDVEAGPSFVRNHRPCSGVFAKYEAFLSVATGVELATTPEYSCPWEVLLEAIGKGVLPREDGLWVLGCESVAPDVLEDIKAKNQNVIWIHEPLPTTNGAFLNPACYVFRVPGDSRPVVAVQFKITPSRVEHDNLILGNVRYVLRNGPDSNNLFTLICSDSLDFEMSSIDQMYSLHPYLVIHLQMNPSPRHGDFTHYRQRCYSYDSPHCDFLCVNWSGCQSNGVCTPYGGSAIYMKQVDTADSRINANHQLGLYYAYWQRARANVYYFNPDEYIFSLRMSKSWQNVPASLCAYTGPEMLAAYTWSDANRHWVSGAAPADGLVNACGRCGVEPTSLFSRQLPALDADRLFALSSAHVDFRAKDQWHKPQNLPLLRVDNSEETRRPSFFTCDGVLDPVTSSYISNLWFLKTQIVPNPALFPIHVSDLRDRCSIDYDSSGNGKSLNCNLYDPDDPCSRATAAFLGDRGPEEAKHVRDQLAQCLGTNWRRLVVWYRHSGDVQSVPHQPRPLIDDDFSLESRSIVKEAR